MTRILLYIISIALCVGGANAAVRDSNSVARSATTDNVKKIITRSTETKRVSTARADSTENKARSTSIKNTSSARSTAIQTTAARSAMQNSTARSAKNTTATTAARSATKKTSSARSAKNTANIASTIARAALSPTASSALGTGYTACRDAYFTCMDQFCASNDDTYRRCVCSSRLNDIITRENALGQATTQLQDFKDLNLSVIDKTSAEVTAMLSASAGEIAQANAKDTSNSAKQLAGISEVLSKTKSNSLSNQGTLDIAGDISAIWETVDLAGGNNIANLTGEALYNAVHAQCSEMVKDVCQSDATRTMVVSAYGMYIENDCSLLQNSLDKKLTATNSDIRSTERDMNLARLNNYDAHNSLTINECIARVRQDVTSDVACGTDYVHCLDITGKYLNYTTGEPIYTADFFQLENMLSLSGDILKNPTNRMTISKLDNMRKFASTSLDTCRDVSDTVWDEFIRQALTEIYQGQHDRIRNVKDECLNVVNTCYDEQNKSLKDFSKNADETTYGMRLELSEQMCQEKLNACSNLYGGGSTGMEKLVNTMHEITNEKIAQQCFDALQAFAKKQCFVPSNDSTHAYPYSCRTYAPGEQKYMNVAVNNITCQDVTSVPNTTIITERPISPVKKIPSHYSCGYQKRYTSCNEYHYLANILPPTPEYGVINPDQGIYEAYYQYTSSHGTICKKCPSGYACPGGTERPVSAIDTESLKKYAECGDYPGSLYQLMVKYAKQMCIRPSEATTENPILPESVLQDVNKMMDQIRADMSKQLSAECERLGGLWVDTEWKDIGIKPDAPVSDGLHDINGDSLYKLFYEKTSANTKWGYCKDQATEQTYTIIYQNSSKHCGKHTCSTPTGSMEPTVCTYGKQCTLRNNNFSITIHRKTQSGTGTSTSGGNFNGWKLNNIIYQNGATVTNLTDIDGGQVTLEATWR